MSETQESEKYVQVAWQYREIRHPTGCPLPENEIGVWQDANERLVSHINSIPPAECRFELRPLYAKLPAPPST